MVEGVRPNSGVAVQHTILFACRTITAEGLAIIVMQSVTCLFEVMHLTEEQDGDFICVLGRICFSVLAVLSISDICLHLPSTSRSIIQNCSYYHMYCRVIKYGT
jgi:hypothetical protein